MRIFVIGTSCTGLVAALSSCNPTHDVVFVGDLSQESAVTQQSFEQHLIEETIHEFSQLGAILASECKLVLCDILERFSGSLIYLLTSNQFISTGVYSNYLILRSQHPP